MLTFKTLDKAIEIANEISALELRFVDIWQRFNFDSQKYGDFLIFTFRSIPDEQRHMDKYVYGVSNYETPYSISRISPKHNIELIESFPTIEQRTIRYTELVKDKYWKNLHIIS